MALTLYEAAKRSRNPLTRGTLLAIATSDEMTAMIPMVRKSGESWSYKREKTLSAPGFVAPDHTSISEGTSTDDKVLVPKRILIGDADVYLFAEDEMDDLESQRATEIEKKLKATGRVIADKAINGAFGTGFTISTTFAAGPYVDAVTWGPNQDTTRHGPGSLKYTHTGTFLQYRAPGDRTYGPQVACAADGSYTLPSDNPNRFIVVTLDVSDASYDTEMSIYATSTTNEPDGLKKLIPSSQIIASSGANGDALGFPVMDSLIDEKVKTRGRLAFVGNAKVKGKFLSLLRSAGGLTAGELAIPGINQRVPTYRGIPFLQNDWIASNESKGGASTLSSLYLVDFDGETGFYAGVSSVGEDRLVDATPSQQRVMGLRVRSVGELEAKEAIRSRVSWYGAFGLGSELAAARASEIVTA